MELKEKTEGVCIPSKGKPIPFVRCHIVASHEGREYIFYIYRHVVTQNWFVFNQPYDTCLGSAHWSKRLWNSFKKHQKVVNPRGMNDEYIALFRVPQEMVEEMEGLCVLSV